VADGKAFVASVRPSFRTSRASTDGWKQKHDDSYYRSAIEKSKGLQVRVALDRAAQ
jgi:hypothetical protein